MTERKRQATSLNPSSSHATKPSLETNASGFAESAISYSAFPEPPSSIPVSPIASAFGPPSPGLLNPQIPARPHYGPSHAAASPIASTFNRFSRSTLEHQSARLLSSHRGKQDSDSNSASAGSISPFDWHEGASSIDVDAAEDRLLPTSFITSLLRENSGTRNNNRTSRSSDAISGISEMTYPPRKPYTDSLRDSSATFSQGQSRRQSHKIALPRPVGARAPSSFHFRNSQRVGVGQGPTQITPTTLPAKARPDPPQATARSGSALSQSTLIAEQLGTYGKSGGKAAAYSDISESDTSVRPPNTHYPLSALATPDSDLARSHLSQHTGAISRRGESIYSTKSAAPSFISRISSLPSVRRVLTWRRKPLPPIPTIPHISLAAEREHRKMEEQAPLPDLVNRANQLHGLLEKGYHPHQSLLSYPSKSGQFTSSFDDDETVNRHQADNKFRQPSPPSPHIITWLKSNKAWVALGIFVVIAIITIGSAVGVTKHKNKPRGGSCSPNWGGASCGLNTTCVCTTTSSPCGKPLAGAIVNLIPVMNDHHSVNFSTSAVYNSVWMIQGQTQGSNCLDQVDLIDVSPSLDSKRFPIRAQWAQTALLWTLTQTQDSTPLTPLQDFIKKADWAQLQNSDGPVTSAGSSFTTSSAGYTYDFAAQTIVPIPATFIGDGKPKSEQLLRVDDHVRPSLDRMYSYAVASSKQQEIALSQYWTRTLFQHEDQLEAFKAAFINSPIVLPLDATIQSVRSLYSSNSTPPPPACYTSLGAAQRTLIDAVEGKAFGLTPSANGTNQFNTTCFTRHPTYGVLDVLRLHSPFLDSRTNVPKQGVVLAPDTAPRTFLAVGEVLSALPGSVNVTRNMASLVDPRNYGTAAYANHIILQYLSSVSVNMANAIIKHIQTQAHAPPSPTEPSLFPLESLPSLEVAVFGSIGATDVASYLSSFTTSSGSLFFGSADGSAFRNWAISRGGVIAWSENATTPEVVRDGALPIDDIFNQTWTAAAAAITSNAPNVGLVNITNSFRSNQRFNQSWPFDV